MAAPRPEAPLAGRLLLWPLLIVGVLACQDNETAIARGDRLWADSSFASALAEYRLAASQRDDEDALYRLAHALARMDELDEARAAYDRLLLESSEYRDQAAWDLLELARRALARDDPFTASEAMSAALALRPELTAPDGVEGIGAFYEDRDQPEAALDYYRRALTALPPDSAVSLLYRIGRLEEERGECGRALDYFRAFREQAEGRRSLRSAVGEARWHTGSCSFRLAEEAEQAGAVDEALGHLETMIRIGQPENLLDRAWFRRGELLVRAGRFDEALAAYRRVVERNPARAGRLVEQAQNRIDDIRFGVLPEGGSRPRADTSASGAGGG